METLVWTENGMTRHARWHSETGVPTPQRVEVVDDALKADVAYKLARKGVALLWRGDYHNARQLLRALGKRADREANRRGRDERGSAAERFLAHRRQRARRAKILGSLIVVLDDGAHLRLRRAPDVASACHQAYGVLAEDMCVSLNELSGVLSAAQWQEKGVEIQALGARIHPGYGVFSPVRGEYVDLVDQAPIPTGARTAFDLGTGTGVLAVILARRGLAAVTATDINPRAVTCARDNVERFGYTDRIRVEEADLFPSGGQADLIVCNPPWLPSTPTSDLEKGVYDPDSDMLKRYLAGLGSRLAPGGEGWLIISNLAEELGLRGRDELPMRISEAGLRLLGHLDTTPRHPRAQDESDPLHVARSREVTTLWRLALDPD